MKFTLFLVVIFCAPLWSQNSITVYFPSNSEMPDESSMILLNDWTSKNPAVEVQKLFGYCDEVDNDSYNKVLAAKRIESVLEILKSKNISISKTVETNPIGENFSRSKNQDENRKVEIFYLNKSDLNKRKTEEDVSQINMPEAIELLRKDFSRAKKNSIIRIQDIHFYLNSEEVVPESMPLLDELLDIMERNPYLRIEIHGHICCNPNPNDTRLSFRRAKFIFTYLLDRGISLGRLGYKGFGSNSPIYKIPERTAAEAAANRRVEILVTLTKR